MAGTPIPDKFAGVQTALNAFGSVLTPITPSDTVPLTTRHKYILCGATGGTVTVIDAKGNSEALYVFPGDILKFRPTFIKATGTDAGVVLYGVDDE